MSRGAVQLVRQWLEHLNPEASDERMAIAFATLTGGAVLSILGVLVVAFGDLVLPRPSWIREMGFVAAAGGLPVFLTGLTLALPSRWWERALVAGGLVSTAGAIVMFSLLYPHQWHITVQTPNGYAIGLYLLGTTFLAAGTAGCLGTYLAESVRGAAAKGARGADQREYTDEEIRRDLLWAEEQGWSWGGVRQGQVDVELRLKEDVEPIEFKGLGPAFLEHQEREEASVTSAKALTNLQGIQPERTDTDVEDQVGHLKQLRQAKRQEEQARRESWAWKLTHPFQWLGGD